jgi:aconitate hydratase
MPTITDIAKQSRQTLDTALGNRTIYRLGALEAIGSVERLPYSIKVLLEACLRNFDGRIVTEEHLKALANYDPKNPKAWADTEIPFMPGRVVLQDFTGVPAVVDLAAMRAAMLRMTGDPANAKKVNPLVPCDLVIDHSVQVDAFNSGTALTINSQREFERNNERYELLKWAQTAFDNFRVVPPATGIVHQVNLEYLARVVWEAEEKGPGPSALGTGKKEESLAGSASHQGPRPKAQGLVLYPDSLVGTDSHTTMINGLGVVGWGVGGIEAEAVMLGQPIYMLIPEVVGFKLSGKLPEGATATDLVLYVTQMLRKHGVVNKFVEFWGPGLSDMPVANRATIANMAPEYGATIGFFPVDDMTLEYMRLSGRDEKLIRTVEQYYKAQGMWRDDSRRIAYASELELDLGTVEPSLAGPRRPQDRIALSNMKTQWRSDLEKTFGKPPDAINTTLVDNPSGGWVEEGGAPEGQAGNMPGERATAVAAKQTCRGHKVECDGETFHLTHGDVVIAAITSCTNTSNPGVMLAAGLLARNARKRGLKRKPWVKTSLAPGSKVVTEYLNKANLMGELEALGFYLVGYGCTTCIGNSGPLPEPISKAINEHDIVAASVLSGNRNFEGRIHPDCRANYLASPPLVVAYALVGTVNHDLSSEPLGKDEQGKDVYLRDIWPSQKDIADAIATAVTRQQFIEQYAHVFDGSGEWQAITPTGGAAYAWNEKSTYVQEPPFFVDMPPEAEPIESIRGARCLVKVGDSVTTDHISPAGAIKKDSPAGKFLMESGVPVSEFNSYGSRRGNDRVMTRGTFANIRVKNQLAPGTEGGFTTYMGAAQGELKPGTVTSIYEASMAYQANKTPLVVLAGKDYGMGSSRDWAAKGTLLLGVRAVIAESYERIHRSNLVGMGVLPLTYKDGQTAQSLGLTGQEVFEIDVPTELKPKQDIKVKATPAPGSGGKPIEFTATCRIDTPIEVDYYRNGGILHTVLRRMAKQ